jgi:Ni/Co efflux regulator RcnB
MHAVHLVLVSALCAGLASPTWADNDKNKGKGNDNDRGQGQSQNQGNRGDNKGNDNRGNDRGAVIQTPTRVVVTDRDRTTVYTYYRTEFTSGNCPPGLAKKNNGCLPPGQAKKLWGVGQPLPPTVVYYPLPQPLMLQLAPPPPGYDYVRIDDDIVLMRRDTRLVSEIITNLSQLLN